jgi:hypothetical protein
VPQFEKGNSFGKGRPRGSRNKSAAILDEIGLEGLVNVIRSVQQRANKGSLRAAAILFARVWPVARGRPVAVDLPSVETTAGLVEAHAALVGLMAAGELTPNEALAISRVLDAQCRALETYDHEKRLQALEDKRLEGPNPFQKAAEA